MNIIGTISSKRSNRLVRKVSLDEYKEDIELVKDFIDGRKVKEIEKLLSVEIATIHNFIKMKRTFENGYVRYFENTIRMLDCIKDGSACNNGKIVGGELPYVPDFCWHYEIDQDPIFVV